MFWGSTNDDAYLKDTTGNARFYPVKLELIDQEAIRRDRDQLIGEAATYLDASEAKAEEWWVPPYEVAALLDEERKAREETDPWHDEVARYVDGLQEVCSMMILCGHSRHAASDANDLGDALNASIHRHGLNYTPAQVTSRETKRVIGILRQLGWVNSGKMPHGHVFSRSARYVRGPEAAKAADTSK